MTEVEERIFIDAYKNTRENDEYTKNINEIISLGRKIMKTLGQQRMMFLEYERLVGLTQGIYLENVYAIGVKDGQKIETPCPTKCPTKNQDKF